MQDGVDLITALAIHPETARRLARKFWNFFISEIHPPDPDFVESTAAIYLQNRTEIRPVVRYILTLALVQRSGDALRALFMAGGIRRAGDQEVGWQGFSLDKARSPLAAMGQQLFEPPNVGGWPPGAAWFSTGTMLARTNFAATLAASQKGFLAADLQADGGTPQAVARVNARSRDARATRLRPAAGARCRTWAPLEPGSAAGNNSTPGPRALRASSLAPPNTSSFRRD